MFCSEQLQENRPADWKVQLKVEGTAAFDGFDRIGSVLCPSSLHASAA